MYFDNVQLAAVVRLAVKASIINGAVVKIEAIKAVRSVLGHRFDLKGCKDLVEAACPNDNDPVVQCLDRMMAGRP